MTDSSALLGDSRHELARLLPALDALLAGLDEATWHARPAPAEWAPVEIVCHLRDEETEDFGARLRVVVLGEASFTPIDPERWAVERRYGEAAPDEALAALRSRRAESLAWLGTLDAAALRGAVRHPQGVTLSGLDLLAAWVCHDRLHLAQMAATLARLWASRWAPLRVGYAGPIPYEPPRSS
jgi:hypothetical protein